MRKAPRCRDANHETHRIERSNSNPSDLILRRPRSSRGRLEWMAAGTISLVAVLRDARILRQAQQRAPQDEADGQGNRVKKSCGNETCEKVVVPGGDFAFGAEAWLAGSFPN